MVFPNDRASASKHKKQNKAEQKGEQQPSHGQANENSIDGASEGAVVGLGQTVLYLVEQAAQFSTVNDGVTRHYLTREHRYLLDWLQQLAYAWHYQFTVDDFGNARFVKAARKNSSANIIMATHQDTVAGASPFSSLVGVLLALVAFKEVDPINVGIEIIALADEQGARFNTAFSSSSVFAGRYNEAILKCVDKQGKSLDEALKAFGLNAKKIPQLALNPNKCVAFVEVTMDQNNTLGRLELPLALVGSVTGVERFEVEINCDHAGPQRDALSRAAQIINWVNKFCLKTNQLEGVVGKLTVAPNAVNIPPRRASLAIELRSPDAQVQNQAKQHLLQFLQSFSEVSCRCSYSHVGVDCDEKLLDTLGEGLAQSGLAPHIIFSNVANAVLELATVVPCATLMVRSKKAADVEACPEDLDVAILSMQHFYQLVDQRAS